MNIKELITNIPRNYLTKWMYSRPDVMSPEDTIKYIKNNNVSVSRFGDGEVIFMSGLDLNFQKHDKKLADKMRVVRSTEKCLVCIPNIFHKSFFSKQKIKSDEYVFWKKNLIKHEYRYKKLFGKMTPLGDAFITRFYMRYNDKSIEKNKTYVKLLKTMWNNRNVVFIEGENSRLGYGNDLFDNANSIRRMLCPAKNAFEVYDKIMDCIKNKCNKEDLLILALGPTATAMAFELSEMGYQALDLGHIDIEYEWFLLGVDHKVAIPHKHVNECGSMGETEESKLDEIYKKQIIDRIGLKNKE